MRWFVTGVGLVFASTAMLTAGQEVAIPQKLVDARILLTTLYPDLQGKALSITFSPAAGDTAMDVRVQESLDQPTTIIRPPQVRQMLDAKVDYDQARTLRRFEAKGPWLHDTDNARLRERLQAASATNAIPIDESSRFSLKTSQSVLATGGFDRLIQAIGSFTSQTTALKFVARDASTSYGAVWEVSGQATRGASTHGYTLQFEPYGGRLVGVKRIEVAR